MAKTVFTPEGSNGTAFTRDDRGLDLLDTINGQAQKNARTWQIVALASLSSFFIALGVLIYAESLPRTVPVVVTVNPDGEARYVGKLDPAEYTANIPEIAREYAVKQLIGKMHTWVVDRDAQKRYIAETQALTQGGAVGQLDRFYRDNNPFARIGEIVQSVDVEPLHKQADQTYFTYFTTTRKAVNGFELDVTRYSILVNIAELTPNPTNPLGVFVVNFDIKRMTKE
jgi:type IV secretory pathway TrbF-like protein